jgi:glycosyltransferase involved in cell wall biosynthesis
VNSKLKNQRKHYQTSFLSCLKILFWFLFEFTTHIPELYSPRLFYKKRKKNLSNPSVALAGDNLDEVNGIALHTRTLVRTFRRMDKPVYLVGVAFHTKKPRMEVPTGSIFMVPGRCSMDLPGYQSIEIAVPRIELLLRLLKKYPLDLIEIETPNPVGLAGLIIGKLLGIKTVSHYRTDLPSYFKILIKSKAGVWWATQWVKTFTRFGGPIIVPSEAFKKKVNQMGVPERRIYKLPRGVALNMFHPDKKSEEAWIKFASGLSGTRIVYMGRISREKNLQLLADAFPRLLEQRPEAGLVVIGDGPYLEEMKQCLSNTDRAVFTGVLRGHDLAGVMASADIMVFPSTTDTFGNTVLEALASGIPSIVSDQGGPQEIIEEGKSGLIFKGNDIGDFLAKIIYLIDHPEILQKFKLEARNRALQFTHEKSAERFWEFYCSILKEK